MIFQSLLISITQHPRGQLLRLGWQVLKFCVIVLECAVAWNCVLACMSVNDRGALEGMSRGMLERQHACIIAKDCRFAFHVVQRVQLQAQARRIRIVNKA
jgi:hypothetical protein